MTARAMLLVILATVLVWADQPQAPTAVAEKITTHIETTTRVSLFSNRLVVVSVRSETDDFIHRAEIEPDEYMVYLQTLEDAAETLSNNPVSSDVESDASSTTLIVNVGPDAPMTFTFSPLATLDLSLGKIVMVMEDIRIQALEVLPGEIELAHWQPEIGDCVELRQGGRACVIFLEEDETVVLRREDIAMTYMVAPEDRAGIILKLVEPER
ncbi:MAG: hypothetical protein V2I67_16585 [Thermoanaerobaculales bacterium]|jgi:hypothetical protein|nr:hypothetical protein [Thermoanaerobaculales bacterium]